ncbi:hypothetical protein [Flavobacterium sp. GSA192]|uniref:hypothetical protein n=1 Tax=Flavobacterium sp. GSA192 TaxID=2576304 RepID=UPI00112E1765|nr:hypothetical protein [Flavobacterium sp. GSA192]
MKRIIVYRFLLGILLMTVSSCEEILLETDISKEEVQLIAPANNTNFSSTGVSFTWETVPDATKYRLQIAKPNFESPTQIVLDTIVSKTSFTQQLAIGSYEWRVKALNSAYETAYFSRFFSISSNDDFQNNTVVLNTPANNLITKTDLQNLSWQAIIGATNYQLQIYDSSNTIKLDQTLTATSYSYTFAEGSYSWRVRAINGEKQTLYTSRNILVDKTAPNTPTLVSPVNASTASNTTVSFQWNRTAIAGSVEKDSIYIYTNSALTALQLKAEATSPYSSTLTTGTYYWYTKAFDAAGNTSAKSSTFSFTIN